jgi:UDP-N-acetylglucosamine diphosphorylase/glucosamine-1-phosphate N-acetyltransferase
MRAVGYPTARIYFVPSSKLFRRMTNIVLFDDPILKAELLPFTYTRPVSEIRCGILTLTEKWQNSVSGTYSFLTDDYLRGKFPPTLGPDNTYINGSVIPNEALINAIRELQPEEALYNSDEQLIALRTLLPWKPGQSPENFIHRKTSDRFQQIQKKWHVHQLNGSEIVADVERLKASGHSFTSLSDPFTICYCPEQIFVAEGAVVRASILNASGGPIYIGKNALIQEGSTIQGPFSLGEGAILAQGTKIRPNTTVGPFCKVGGEVNNSVFFGYSNKGHDGYLGNAVVGEWCNLGANTNNSNLKNDYSSVKLFSHASGELEDTGLANCGLYMGDYSKSGINTMFNTGTVVGVQVNVFGAGFQEKFIPSFSWGGKTEGYYTFRLDKALHVAQLTVQSKNCTFTESDATLLEEIHKRSALYRTR